jgi:integrase
VATIKKRGPFQFQARVRRNGVSIAKTFETKSEAQEWARIIEGQITGGEHKDTRKATTTTLSEACEWYGKTLNFHAPSTKNKRSILKYWSEESGFGSWSLKAIRPADLMDWQRKMARSPLRPSKRASAPSSQTIIHHLNTLSQIFKKWTLEFDEEIRNPVVEGVRPSLPKGRDRRLNSQHDENGMTEEDRLLAIAEQSKSSWLKSAIIISLETCLRQAELASLTWTSVHLKAKFPYCDIAQTKNDRPRRVPLSKRAVHELELLRQNRSVSDPRILPIETAQAIGHAWRTVMSKGGFPNLRWHDLRHEAISRLFERTELRDNEIMTISGHLRPEMLTRYIHRKPPVWTVLQPSR